MSGSAAGVETILDFPSAIFNHFSKKKKKLKAAEGELWGFLSKKNKQPRMCVKGGCAQRSSLTVERLVLVFARKRDEKGES